LGTGPLERLLDLGPRSVRQLGGLVTCLLEQPGGARLGLLDLLRSLLLCVLDGLTSLSLRGIEHLGPLTLALGPVAIDVGLPCLKLALAPSDLFFGPAELGGRGGLGVA